MHAPDTGSSTGSKKKVPPGSNGRHHDAAEAVLLRPVDVAHRLVDIVEGHERLSGPASWRLRGEVRQPAVARLPGLNVRDRANPQKVSTSSAGAIWKGMPLGNNTSATTPWCLHVLHTEIRVPLRRNVEPRLDATRLRRSRRLVIRDPLVEDIEITASRRSPGNHCADACDATVHRDDRGEACHGPPSLGTGVAMPAPGHGRRRRIELAPVAHEVIAAAPTRRGRAWRHPAPDGATKGDNCRR